MIRLEKIGLTGSDDTAAYKVQTTCIDLRSFIEEVLMTFSSEWGEFEVVRKIKDFYESVTIGYRYGRLLEEYDRYAEDYVIYTLDEIPKFEILQINASGGSTRMDYTIEVKDDE